MDHKPKILIVEDNTDTRELFSLVLKRGGFDVIEATTGLDAIESTRANLPDLILMDLMMPKMSGDEATVQLKTDPATRHIPIILCTAALKSEAIDRAMAAGAAKILHKPIGLKTLSEEMLEFLHSENTVSSVTTTHPFADELRAA
jgi:CheY-like chemotaxis protein